ncbi:hypothetical protein RJ492_004565 [Pluralibacter gergoviae]|uniref:Uncharacterized protein n=1 Tax=Pluralibacter gergoviae TaxID=61647 RepID=A0AAI9DPR1_PLUGE|nr:hypothetical protein [Pluralibacter gergoviae]AVR02630.1 hypothetical protein A8H26_07950 [Pluralibacter gergoviae]EKT9642627.1 hypothetical protein [Pluralibacter gergoviae]EKV0917520.1 hypothetical protein [Pluralibacter gergoviae]EKV0932662.1 hypothetical protein [Pluralibacter gergoviae]EKV3541441.1 hypothetical protein [Pluralibacter gergoviae]
MWHDLKLEHVGRIEKTVAEFTVWMITVLPYAKMKVKIYEDDHGNYKGRTDLQIKRKFDGCPESAIGYGNTIEEALEDTISYFNSMLKEDGFEELTEKDIEYSEYSDF